MGRGRHHDAGQQRTDGNDDGRVDGIVEIGAFLCLKSLFDCFSISSQHVLFLMKNTDCTDIVQRLGNLLAGLTNCDTAFQLGFQHSFLKQEGH